MIILIAPAIAALLPALVAAIAGGLAQRGGSLADIRRSNLYNHPVNQVRRLREAGLPMAAMGNNISNTQSQLPDSNDLGVGMAAGKLSEYITTRLQQKQLELIEEQIRKTKAEAEGAWKDAGLKANALARDNDMLKYDTATGIKDTDSIDPTGIISYSNQVQGRVRERATAQVKLEFGRIERDIHQINLDNAPEKIRAEINKILQENKNLIQAHLGNESFINWKNRFMNSMQIGGGDTKALLIMGLARIFGIK